MAKGVDVGLLLQLLERAKTLGLEIELTRATRTVRFQTLDNGNISGVWANVYDIVSWSYPRGTKNNQGHQMMKVYTRKAAEAIAEQWSKYTTGNDYYTINKQMQVFEPKDLKKFIALREEEDLPKPAGPQLLMAPSFVSPEMMEQIRRHLDTGRAQATEPAPADAPQEHQTEDVHHEEVDEVVQQAAAPAPVQVVKRMGRPPGSKNKAPEPVKKAAAKKAATVPGYRKRLDAREQKGGKR